MPEISERPFRISVLTTVILALFIRLLLVFWIPAQPTSDFWSYLKRAESIYSSGIYEAIEGKADATFPPGYPLILSSVFSLPGDHVFNAKLLNVLLGGISVVLIAMIGSALFSRIVGLLSGFLLAIYPRSALLPVILASENLFIPLLFLNIFLILLIIQGKTKKSWTVLVGIVTGLLILTRSIAYPFWLLLPFGLLVAGVSKREVIRTVGVLFVIVHLVLLPWAYRNYSTLGIPTPFTSSAGQNLFIGNNSNSPGYWYPFTSDIEAIYPEWSQMDMVSRDRLAGVAAFEWIIESPANAIRLYARKLEITFLDEKFIAYFSVYGEDVYPPYPPIDVLQNDHYLKRNSASLDTILNITYYSITLFQLAGLIMLFTAHDSIKKLVRGLPWILVAVGLYFPAVSSVFLASTRFKWPMTDLWMVFAALSILNIIEFFRQDADAVLA